MANEELVDKILSKDTVWELFEESMNEFEDTVAVRWKNQDDEWVSLTYGDLRDSSHWNCLQQMGVHTSNLMGLMNHFVGFNEEIFFRLSRDWNPTQFQ